jgi:hypothetical protein
MFAGLSTRLKFRDPLDLGAARRPPIAGSCPDAITPIQHWPGST